MAPPGTMGVRNYPTAERGMTWTDQPSAAGHVTREVVRPTAKGQPGSAGSPASLLELEHPPGELRRIRGVGAATTSATRAGVMDSSAHFAAVPSIPSRQ